MTKTVFCAAPFMQLTLYPNGDIAICCYNEKTHLGNIQHHSFQEIWNGQKMQQIRQDFIEGRHQICQEQIKSRACHSFYGRRNAPLVETDLIQKKYPIRLDLRLNGSCNLDCVMCDLPSQPAGIYNSSFLWSDEKKELFPNLVSIDVLGGEPFIQPDTFRLIEEVSQVNRDCLWSFSTNGNIDFSGKIQPQISKIKIDWIMISIDSLDPKTYSQIRRKGDFNLAIRTLKEMCNFRQSYNHGPQKMKLFASMCVQKNNFHEMPSFYNFCLSKEILPIFHYCSGTHPNSLDQLNTSEKKEIIRFIQNCFKDDQLKSSYEVIFKLKDKLSNESI